MHFGGEKLGQNRGRGHRILSQRKRSFLFVSFFSGPQLLCKISSKSNQNCDRRRADRQTDRQTDRQKDASGFIICLMLCYSNGTDNNYQWCTIMCVNSYMNAVSVFSVCCCLFIVHMNTQSLRTSLGYTAY